MSRDPIVTVAALYHGIVGFVFLTFPADSARALQVEPGSTWLFWFLAAAASMTLGGLLALARVRVLWRPGLLVAAIAAEVVSAAILGVFTVWDGLSVGLIGASLAAALWAWLLWGVLSPEGARS